jgi:hypothetical protein
VAQTNAKVILGQMKKHGVTTVTSSPPFFDRLAEYCAKNPDATP